MNELNINLQGANHLISEMFDKITAFKSKLWCGNCSCSQTLAHFPIQRNKKHTDAKKYVEEREEEQELNFHFQYIHKHEATISLFSMW